MELTELLQKAKDSGVASGMVALIEFIKQEYPEQIGTDLWRYLDKILADQYEYIAEQLEIPTEDVALKVEKLVSKVGSNG